MRWFRYCYCWLSELPFQLYFLVLLTVVNTAWSSSECQISVVSSPDSVEATLYCSGNQVRFSRSFSTDYSTICNSFNADPGTALVDDDEYVSDLITLTSGEDVTFTSVVFRNYDYTSDRMPFHISHCRNCTLKNVVYDNISFSTIREGGIILSIEDSSVTIENAEFTNFGWDDFAASGLARVISAVNSNVTLRNVTFSGFRLMPANSAAVYLEGGNLMAEVSSWLDINANGRLGRLVLATQGAVVALLGCTVHNISNADSLFFMSSGSRLSLDARNTIYLESCATRGLVELQGYEMTLRGAEDQGDENEVVNSTEMEPLPPLTLADSRILVGGKLGTGPQPLPPDIAWNRARILLVAFTTAVATRMPCDALLSVELRRSSIVSYSDCSLARLVVSDNSYVRLHNVSFTAAGLPIIPGPLLQFSQSTGQISVSQFRSMSFVDDDPKQPTSLLDVVQSNVNVTECTFYNLNWVPVANASNSSPSQVLRVLQNSYVRVSSSSFSFIGGSGTAALVDEHSILNLTAVTISDINTSRQSMLRAAISMGSNSSLYAQGSSWSRINVGNSSNGAALTVIAANNIELVGCNFTDITVPYAPAVQFLSTTEKVTIADCTWRDVHADPPLLFQDIGRQKTVIRESRFIDCISGIDSDYQRGTLSLLGCAASTPAVVLFHLVFMNNTAAKGAGLLLSHCDARVSDSAFLGNKVQSSGGGVFMIEGSSLSVESARFENNAASKGLGGALYVENSMISCHNCTLSSNSVANERGGAVALEGGAKGSFTESIFISNKASTFGGAISAVNGSLMIAASTFISNAATQMGGGVIISRGDLLVVNGTTFTRNSARSGGAVACNNSISSRISDTTFFANSASGNGGAVYALDSSLELQDSVMTGNAALKGGALYANCYFFCNGVTSKRFEIELLGILSADTAIAAASRDRLLDQLYAGYNSSSTRIDLTTFVQNTCIGMESEKAGGALFASGHVFISDSTFISNTCPTGGAAAFGGGIQAWNRVVITGSSFKLNAGTTRGGAVSLLDSTEATMYGFFFKNNFRGNVARLYGGAVDARVGWALDLLSNNFTDNGNLETELAGGAIHLASCKNLVTDLSSFPNVMSAGNIFLENNGGGGGALFSDSCNVTLYGDKFIRNRASMGGGAVMASNTDQVPTSTLQVYDITVIGNFAKESGGALLVLSQGFTVYGSTFSNNTARVAGGALMFREVSPTALLKLQRNTDPYYSAEEYQFFQAVIVNSIFEGNGAWVGGGAMYMDTSRMIVKNCTFDYNEAGDGLPNDEWSDSGGAIFAAECFGLSEVQVSNFTRNSASGGPGGAILHNACSFAIQDSHFDCNRASTFGGALAAGNRLTPNSTSYVMPSVTFVSCNFTDNRAMLYDGGALLIREMNATVYVSAFATNQAGRNGGAVALLSTVGSGLRACTLERNRATQYGGAVYAESTSVLAVEDSQFRNNFALVSGGAMSIISCTCVLTSRTVFSGNQANARGGALQLQPATAAATVTDAPANELASGSSGGGNGTCEGAQSTSTGILAQKGFGPCISQFLQQVNSLVTSHGRQLLGLSNSRTVMYNATIAHDGSTASTTFIERFARGGALLAVPRVIGPVQFSGYAASVVPNSGSSVQLAAGSSLALANWAQLQLQLLANDTADARTQVYFAGSAVDIQVEGAEVILESGSAITELRLNMIMLPAGNNLIVTGSTILVGSSFEMYKPNRTVPIYSISLSFKGSATLPDGRTVRFGDWNRFILRLGFISRTGVLMDTITGATYTTDDSQKTPMVCELSNGSPMMGHLKDSVGLTSLGSGNVTVIGQGVWALGNGTTLETGTSTRPAVSAEPADNSTVHFAAGSTLEVASWLPYNVRLQDGSARLECLGLNAQIVLGSELRFDLSRGSVVLRAPADADFLPKDMVLIVQGSSWDVNVNGLIKNTLIVGIGNIAMGLVLPAGSSIQHVTNVMSTDSVMQEARYALWAGPMGTVLYDTVTATVNQLPDSTTVTLGRATPFVRYDGNAVLSTNMSIVVRNASLMHSNGTTTASLDDSLSGIALTVVLAKGSRIVLLNGTALDTKDWYRYLLVVTRAGTILLDTAASGAAASNSASTVGTDAAAFPLGMGTRVDLARGSFLLLHDSFTYVLSSEERLELRGNAAAAATAYLGGKPVDGTADNTTQVVILPAEGSSMHYDSGGGSLMLGANASYRYIPWVSGSGSYLYDAKMLVTFHLAPMSFLILTAGSNLVAHESHTTVLRSETTLRATAGGLWSLSDGSTRALSGYSGSAGPSNVSTIVTGLSVAPIGTSRILYDNLSWRLTIKDSNRFNLFSGTNGTMLHDSWLSASYILANGSQFTLTNSSQYYVRGGTVEPLSATEMKLTLVAGGRVWLLGNNTAVHPGNGTGVTSESTARLHIGALGLLPGELGRQCEVDLSTATYQADPFAYSISAAKEFLYGLSSAELSQADLYAKFARAAYGYANDVDTSSFNSSLLLPPPAGPWDALGRPTGALVTCTATTAPNPDSRARRVNTLQLALVFEDNTAGAMGGAVYVEGGQGSVLLDDVTMNNNTALNGDGGGLALHQDESNHNMDLQVYLVSSRLTGNKAPLGLGGAMSLEADDLDQQAILLNTTLDSNSATAGGALAIVGRISALLNDSVVLNNVAAVTAVAGGGTTTAESDNIGSGGGILASICNELQLNSGTTLENNRAQNRGGGLTVYGCALALLNGVVVKGNMAQGAGGIYVWSDLPVKPAPGARGGDIGASIFIVASSQIMSNSALYSNGSENVLAGIGGGILVRGRVSTLLADSHFQKNSADSQGGSIFIESLCDLTPNSTFKVAKLQAPTAFPTALQMWGGIIKSLQWPRPKGCWGTVVYLPHFVNNEAARSGGALFSSHPEALSLVCQVNRAAVGVASLNSSTPSPQLQNAVWNETLLAEQILMAMQQASYQVLDNRIVQSCYRDEIQRQFNRSIDDLQLSGQELSTLGISNNSALGYGYLIAIAPSKLQVLNVSWSGNTSNVATAENQQQLQSDATLSNSAAAQRRRRLASGSATNSSSDSSINTLYEETLASSPMIHVIPGYVYDNDTHDFRAVLNYHITTHSNKPMDIPILLLDALDQIASENTTLRQAQIRARLKGSRNGCKAELLGGFEGTARNGSAVMVGLRLRALKGENYSVEFLVEDAIIQGTVEPLVVNVTIPECNIGEVPRDDGYVCQKCDQRSFSLWQDTEPLDNCLYPDLENITCYPCPEGGDCRGGAVMVPQQGYWHSAANSSSMNPCLNPDACRQDDDDMQELLAACQEWWYSRPLGFNYSALIDGVRTGNLTGWMNASAAEAVGEAFRSGGLAHLPKDLRQCLLWGLPNNHPWSYMQLQCGQGYQGNLCAVCAAKDGKMYASSGDFECKACVGRNFSITIAVVGFLGNVVTVLTTIMLTFITDYTEEEELGTGDLLKVLIVHMQFFVIVTRLNVNWPISVSLVKQVLSACTGAVSKVYSPACMLRDASPEQAASIEQTVAIVSPLLTTLCVAGLWMMIRVVIGNLHSGSQTEQKLDMRSIDEYKADRLRRLEEKRRLAREAQNLVDDAGDDSSAGNTTGKGVDFTNGYSNGYMYDAYTDLRATELLYPLTSETSTVVPVGSSHSRQAYDEDVSKLLSPTLAREVYDIDRCLAGSRRKTVHLGLPIQQGTTEMNDDEFKSEEACGVEWDVASGLRVGSISVSATSTERRQEVLPSLSLLRPSQPARSATGPSELVPDACDEQAVEAGELTCREDEVEDKLEAGLRSRNSVADEDKSEESNETLSDVDFGVFRAEQSSKVLLPMPPMERDGSFAGSSFSAPPPPPPLAPPPPPPPPLPLPRAASGDYNDNHNGSGAAPYERTMSRLPSGYDTAYLPQRARSRLAVESRGSVDTDAAGGASESAVPRDHGNSSSHVRLTVRPDVARALTIEVGSPGEGRVEDGREHRGGEGDDSGDRRTANNQEITRGVKVVGGASGQGSQGEGSNGGKGGGGGGADGNGGKSGGSGGADGNGGKSGGSGGADGNGGAGRLTFLTCKVSEGRRWFRSFFTYDEDTAGSQVRWASLANIHRTMAWWRQELLVVMIACFVLYPAWAQASLQIFACYYLDEGTGVYPEYQKATWGRGYWILNMNQECYQGNHVHLWVPIGLVGICVICMGIPLLTYMVTWTHRTALNTVHVVQTYGFLYRRYNYETFYWWEAAIQVQTLVLVVVDVFGQTLVVYQQAVLLMIALMAVMWSNMYFQPLKHKLLERMSSLSLAVLTFTVGLGLFFVPPTNRRDPVTGTVATAIGAVIVVLNAGLLLYFVYIMWAQSRVAIRRRVGSARQQMALATSRMHLRLSIVRQYACQASLQIRQATARSMSSLWGVVSILRRQPSTPLPEEP